MKTKFIKYTILLSAIFALSACAHFDDLNQDPDKSTNMDPNLMIPTIQLLSSPEWQSQHRLFIFPGGFMSQWAGNWAMVEYGAYAQTNTAYFETFWNTYYSDALIKNLVDVVERTKDKPEFVNTNAIARIIKVMNFMKLTDYYGDIPYSDAAMGYFTGVYKPKYDKQEDIYDHFLSELTLVVDQFDNAQPKPAVDLFYGGDLNKWAKFANSLRLRVAMRLVKVNPQRAKTEALAAVALGVFTSNDDIAYVKYENRRNENFGNDKGNPISNLIYGRNDASGSDFWLGADLIKTMEDLGDPRILYYGGVFANDIKRTDVTDQVYAKRKSYAAMCVPSQMFSYESRNPNPYPGSDVGLDVMVNDQTIKLDLAYTRMRPSKIVEALDAPIIHLSYAEVELLQAEMAARGWLSGANNHFRKALEAAVNQWSLYGAEVDARAIMSFVDMNPLVVGEELNQIATQLWVLHFLDPLEAWSDWRRTGYPELEFYNNEPSKNQSGGKRPHRIPYPLEEQLKNTDNLQQALDRMGGTDDWMNRVWWDKK